MKVGKAICSQCKEQAKLYYNKKWWCAVESSIGTFNMTGYCKKKGKDVSKKD